MMSPAVSIENKRRQVLSWGLAALLLMAAAPAQAAFRPGAVVLDFQNVSPYSGHLLGRRAADQLALELGATGSWKVVDRAQTRRAARQRDLRAPYAVGLMQELAHALGGDMIFTGAIQKIEVSPKSGTIRLTLLVEAIDQVSGQSAMATVQVGEALRQEKNPQPTDVLVGEALAAAAALAARAVSAGTGVTMTVTEPGDGKTVRLKPVDGAMIRSGCRLLLYRSALEQQERVPVKLIGTLMVTNSGPDAYTARVLAKAGDIHTDDVAVTVCCGQLEE